MKARLSALLHSLHRNRIQLHDSIEELRRTMKAISRSCAPDDRPVTAGSPFEREQRSARLHIETLTSRQRDVFERVIGGQANKVIAFDLHISQKTVETHRARIMRKLKVGSLPALVRAGFIAGVHTAEMPNRSIH